MAKTNDRLLRRRCREVLSELTLPRPWDLEEFVASVERVRGRRIVIEPVPAPLLWSLSGGDHVSGMTRAEPDYDLVLVLEGAVAERALVIVLHELAHLLFGHLVNPSLQARLAEESVVSTREVHVAALARSSWGAPREREAELLATMLLTYSGDHPASGSPSSEVVTRASSVFGLTH